MIFLDDISSYEYTRITAQIRLGAANSDSQDSVWYLEVNNLPEEQSDCYIGQTYVSSVITKLIKNTISNDVTDNRSESVWLVTITLPQVKTEDECYDILNNLCRFFTYESAKVNLIQYAGSPIFTFDTLHLKIQYAGSNQIFSDEVFRYRCGYMQSVAKASTTRARFLLSKTPTEYYDSEYFTLYFNALESRDAISRFVLMYGIIEKIFASTEWQNEAKNYEQLWKSTNVGKKYKLEQHRAVILHRFFCRKGLTHFSFTDSPTQITEDVLARIINVRNDLFHRTDTTQIHLVLYRELIPIIKGFLDIR